MARSRKPVALGPWSAGLNLRDDPQDLHIGDSREALGELAAATNIDLSGSGDPSIRDGWIQLLASDAHSGFEHNGVKYAVIDGDVGILQDSGFTPLASVEGELSWATLDGNPVFSDRSGLYAVDSTGVSRLPYDGEPDEFAGQVVAPMPGGAWLHVWNGRTVVARGASLYFSAAMWYGVYDVARGILPFETQIQWVAALEDGIYVGLRDEVKFLAGRDPYSLVAKRVDGRTVSGAAAVVPTVQMNEKWVGAATHVAVWFSRAGFTIGRPDGSVVTPSAAQLDVTDLGRGRLSAVGSRFTLLPT